MTVHFDHTIISAADKQLAARFYADVFGLPDPRAWGPFLTVALSDGVTLQFAEPGGPVPMQHYAFLVSEGEFDSIVRRLEVRGVPLWADPRMQTPGINHNHGGRGVYFFDPSGHGLEALTRRYGDGPTASGRA